MTTEITYNDGLCPGGRRPRLYLAKGGEVRKFEGVSIEGFALVKTTKFTKNGNWSNTDYTLVLHDGVRPLEFLSPLHGIWGEKFADWGEVIASLQLPLDVAKELVRREYPKTADRLDEIERVVSAMEESGQDCERVVVSFGGPTRKARAEGFWESPKQARTANGTVVEIQPGPNGWNDAEVIQPPGAKIISARHSSGHGGGYYAVEVLVPILEGKP